MPQQGPETVIAIYRVQPEKLEPFLALLATHHPTLVRLGLATEDEAVVYRGAEDDQEGRPLVFEIFTWKDGRAPETAHHTPEVMEIWEALGSMVEKRGGKPEFEFPHVERVRLARAQA